MAGKSDENAHEFVVTAVEPVADDTLDGVAVMLVDARGGRVRLHMDTDMAEVLCSRISAALNKTMGP